MPASRSRGRALGAGQMPAAHRRAGAGGAPRRPRAGDGKRLQVDGLFARRLGARRRAWRWARSPAPVDEAAVLTDWSLCSGVASASAGIELMNNIVIVLGNAREADRRMRHRPCGDAGRDRRRLRVMAALRCRDSARRRTAIEPSRIVNVLAKADPSPDGTGARLAPHHAGRHRHLRDPPRPRRGRRPDRGADRLPGGVRLRRRRAPGPARRRPGRGDRQSLDKLSFRGAPLREPGMQRVVVANSSGARWIPGSAGGRPGMTGEETNAASTKKRAPGRRPQGRIGCSIPGGMRPQPE